MIPLGSHRGNQWLVDAEHVDLIRRRPRPRAVSVDAHPQRVSFDLERTALLVIDMQNDFCHEQGWLASIGVDVAPARAPIAPLTRLLPTLRNAGVAVIWVNWGNRPDRLNLSPSLLHVYKPTGEGTGLGDPLPNGAPVLQQGSWAADVVSALEIAQQDVRIDKYRMSGFWDTPLDSILRNMDVSTLMFAGVNVDQCVMCTLQDANFLGYDCLLLEDCCATTSPGFCTEATLYNVRQCFGFTFPSTQLIAALP